MNAVVAEPGVREREFARLLASELIGFEPEDFSGEALALQFVLSAYLRCCELGLWEGETALKSLRRALVCSAGLDPAEEPTPLLFPDPKARLMNVCQYTYGLLGRAAAGSRRTKQAALEAALAVYG